MAYIIKLCASDVCVPVCACYHYRYIEMELDWIGLDWMCLYIAARLRRLVLSIDPTLKKMIELPESVFIINVSII